MHYKYALSAFFSGIAQQSLLQLSQAEDQAAELQQRAAAIQREAAQAADAAAFYTTHAAAAAEYEFDIEVKNATSSASTKADMRFVIYCDRRFVRQGEGHN